VKRSSADIMKKLTRAKNGGRRCVVRRADANGSSSDARRGAAARNVEALASVRTLARRGLDDVGRRPEHRRLPGGDIAV